MARVITYSLTFPPYHPRAGQQTFFREKIWAGLADTQFPSFKIPDEITNWDWHEYYNAVPKFHTVRAGHRFKVGDKFSPRVWAGRPYNSKQITIAPDIEVKKIWNFRLVPALWIDECKFFLGDHRIEAQFLKLVAKNDGLTLVDFVHWFGGPNMADSKRKPFEGQVICWNDKIVY